MEEVRPILDLLDVPMLERHTYNGLRCYLSRDPKGDIVAVAGGVTGIIDRSIPVNHFLDKWKFGFGGYAEYKTAMDTMAYYGTLLHIVLGDCAQGLPVMLGESDIDKMFRLNEKTKGEGGLPEYSHVRLPATVNDKVYDFDKFRKDAIAIYVFFKDVYEKYPNAKVVGIELPLADFKQGYGGCLDLVVKIDDRYVIFDLKTGSGHYRRHDLQLNAYHRLLTSYLKTDKVTMADIHLKNYSNKTLKSYLNGRSKTTPYNLVKVDESDDWEHYLKTYYLENGGVQISDNEINYDTTLDEVVAQLKGE